MIPFVDLKAQSKHLEDEIRAGIDRVLEHGRFILGPEVSQLEQKLAEYVDVPYALACSSGTDALAIALMAQGVGPGDAVLTTPFTFIATAEAIALLGATPVFVDIEPDTFNIDIDKLAQTINALKEGNPGALPLPRACQGQQAEDSRLTAKGIISVDLFGLPPDYDRINALATEHGLFVIEDAAQSFGAGFRGRTACGLADIGATSFFPAKPLGCYGDGGAVFTRDENLAKIMSSILRHGQGEEKYSHERIGINGRLDTIQAAVLLAKLGVFPDELKKRRQVADRYGEYLDRADAPIRVPRVPEGVQSAWAQYSIMVPFRNRVKEALAEKGIPSAIYYPKPLHLQKAFSHFGYAAGDMPVAEHCSEQIISLPMHPYLGMDEVDRIAEAVLTGLNGSA